MLLFYVNFPSLSGVTWYRKIANILIKYNNKWIVIMRVVIVGTGYVGLVSGVCFADFGHSVICVDKDLKKIQTLKSGGVPIYEPGLEDLIHNLSLIHI